MVLRFCCLHAIKGKVDAGLLFIGGTSIIVIIVFIIKVYRNPPASASEQAGFTIRLFK